MRAIGSGGMGTVYEALDSHNGDKVALKLLHGVHPNGIYRLKQEFRSLTDVSHPNLIKLHELFTDGKMWFFTMDLVAGTPLLEGLGANADEHTIRRAFAEVATGIHAIHQAGKLHRDLKPSNVLLSKEGNITILDFGLAIDQKKETADSGIKDVPILGTPLYMAPEQTVSKNPTKASDWYAFGTMLFEALVGKSPFSGSIQNIFLSKQHQTAPSVSSLRSDVSQDLNALCAKLLVREPRDRAEYAQIVRVLEPTGADAVVPSAPTSVAFVGREKELASLAEAFETAVHGQSVIAFIHGISGIGKSALAEQFLHRMRLHEHTVILTGRCYERESVPYKGCDSLIDHLSLYLDNLPSEQAAEMLPPNLPALGEMFPVLQGTETTAEYTRPSEPNKRRIAAVSALKILLSRIARRGPLVLFVDDLQWCDEDGAKLLASTMSPPDPPSLLLLVAYRSEEAGQCPGLDLFLERVRRQDGIAFCDLSIGELDASRAQEMAVKLLPEAVDTHITEVVSESDGNPYFITELSRYWQSIPDHNQPLSLSTATKQRIDTLSSTDREILEAICISNGPIEQNLLKQLLPREDIASGLRRLQDAGFIAHVADLEGSVRAYHDKLRETVLTHLDQRTEREWHQRFASALESLGPAAAIQLTDHLQRAGLTEEAGTCAEIAANHAVDNLAFAQAAKLYRIALERNPGDRNHQRNLQIQLGDALGKAGHGAESASTYLQASPGAPLAEEIRLRQLAAEQWITTGHLERGSQELENVLKAAGARPYKSAFTALFGIVFSRLLLKLRGLTFKKQIAEMIEEKDRLALAAYKAAMQGFSLADPLRSIAYSLRYLRQALHLGLVEDVAIGLAQEAIQLSVVGVSNRAASHTYLHRAFMLRGEVDTPLTKGYLVFATGSTNWWFGDLAEAKKSYEKAEKIYLNKCENPGWEYTMLKSHFGLVHYWLGSWGAMVRQWNMWIQEAEAQQNLFLLTVLRIWPMGAIRWLVEDRPEKAWKLISTGLAEAPQSDEQIITVHAAICTSFTNIYAGNYLDCFHPLEKVTRAFARSLTGKISSLFNVMTYFQLAFAALAHALVANKKKPLWAVAQQQAKKLTRDGSPMALAYVPIIRAAIAHQKGDDATAKESLHDAIDRFDKLQYKLYAAAARRQLGRILGGDEGQALIEKSQQAMREEGIINPERIAAMLAPGFFV